MLTAGLCMACLLIAALSIRYFLLKRELRRLSSQLRKYNGNETQKRVDLIYYQRDLEQLAVEINRQMERVTLSAAEKRRVEEELRQAVANISHDLRTPLTSIFGYLQMLESGELSPEERSRYFGIVKNRTNRLRALLDDFFELSVIESVDYRLKLERIDIARLLPEILIGYYDRFNDKRMDLHDQLPQAETFILADEAAVKRVVENLVLNTIRHAEGRVDIVLAERGASVALEIRNRAAGLSGTDVEQLFNRFHMADQTRSASGSGLGLPIARSLMLKMDGSLTAALQGEELKMTAEWKKV